MYCSVNMCEATKKYVLYHSALLFLLLFRVLAKKKGGLCIQCSIQPHGRVVHALSPNEIYDDSRDTHTAADKKYVIYHKYRPVPHYHEMNFLQGLFHRQSH